MAAGEERNEEMDREGKRERERVKRGRNIEKFEGEFDRLKDMINE